ncbi:MAG TPA: hypothetical protein ACFYD3_00525 [Candidatus Hypogeohydataceae bacterium YC41]
MEFANRKLPLQAVTTGLGVFCGISIFYIILDIVRLLLAHHMGLPLTPFIIKLSFSVLLLGNLAILACLLEIEWRNLWKIISAGFLLFGFFFQFYSRIFDVWVWVKISNFEFWGILIGADLVSIILIILATLEFVKYRRLTKKLCELMRLINSVCKKDPEAGEVLKNSIRQRIEKKGLLEFHEKQWLKATGDKFSN